MGRAWDLPPSTFGGAYAKFMGDRNFQADDRYAALLAPQTLCQCPNKIQTNLPA